MAESSDGLPSRPEQIFETLEIPGYSDCGVLRGTAAIFARSTVSRNLSGSKFFGKQGTVVGNNMPEDYAQVGNVAEGHPSAPPSGNDPPKDSSRNGEPGAPLKVFRTGENDNKTVLVILHISQKLQGNGCMIKRYNDIKTPRGAELKDKPEGKKSSDYTWQTSR